MLGKDRLFIEIRNQEIRFLLWKKRQKNKKHNLLFECVSYELNTQDFKGLVKILSDYRLNKLNNKKIDAYLLVPFQNGLLREYRLPWVDIKNRDAAVNYYLQHEISGLASDFKYIYQVTEEQEMEYITIRVIVARKDVIDFYTNCLEKSGFNLLGIEYSISALEEVFSGLSGKSVLYIQSLKDKQIQMVLYKDMKPEIVVEATSDQVDVTKYQIYLGLEDEDIPIDFLMTDQSEQAKNISLMLLESGLVKEPIKSVSSRIVETGIELKEGAATYPLIAELYRVKDNKNLNFYPELYRKRKIKAILLSISCVIIGFVLLINTIWLPKYKELQQLKQELDNLESQHVYLQNDKNLIELREWYAKQKRMKNITNKISDSIENIGNEITLTRLNYKNNTLYLWAECTDEIAIKKIIDNLVELGWKEPILRDYHYDKTKIEFCLSVEGGW